VRGPWEFEDPRCRGIDTDVYFPPEDGTAISEKKLIVYVCGNCVHKSECADWGVRNERFGIWGGLTEPERRDIRKQLNIILKGENVA
jgi:WhiB family redox-sensing transcriptional regulator